MDYIRGHYVSLLLLVKCVYINFMDVQVRQYKHERECNSMLQQSREDKIARLEALMAGVLPSEIFLTEEWAALIHEHKVGHQ